VEKETHRDTEIRGSRQAEQTGLVRRAADGLTHRFVRSIIASFLALWHSAGLTAGLTCEQRCEILSLGSSLQQAKAKGLGKGGGEAMNGHLKW
jgi:hypothetical protein